MGVLNDLSNSLPCRYAGAFGYDLDGAVAEKLAFNARRADHKAEARLLSGGKKW